MGNSGITPDEAPDEGAPAPSGDRLPGNGATSAGPDEPTDAPAAETPTATTTPTTTTPTATTSTAETDRRRFLKGALLVGAGAVIATTFNQACRTEPGIQVVVPWSGREREVFGRVLSHYGRPVNVETGGDDIDLYVQAQHRTGRIPDVVILPRPGLVRRYARDGWLEPMPRSVANRFGDAWNQHITAGESGRPARPYGAWVKAAHKSVLWYRPSLTGGDRPMRTWTWTDFREWVERLARLDGPRPLAIGAADGWVLTDWFENLLAGHADRGLYDALACGQPHWDAQAVRAAFLDLAEVWRIDNAILFGRDTLLMEFEEAVRHVVDGTAVATIEGDFVDIVIDGVAPDDPAWDRPEAEFFPRINTRNPLVVGGDIAVVRRGSRRGMELVEWLTDGEALEAWMAERGYLTPNQLAPDIGYRSDLQTYLGGHLLLASPDELRFDLSDQLPGALTGTDGRGSWQFLTAFFTDVVTRRVSVDEAVEAVIQRFATAAREIELDGSC